MLLYLVTYDIPCNKRRKKVSDLLEGYGQRVQFSVFECVLPSGKYQELCDRLQARIHPTEDSVRLYPLSSHTVHQVQVFGGAPVLAPPSSIVV